MKTFNPLTDVKPATLKGPKLVEKKRKIVDPPKGVKGDWSCIKCGAIIAGRRQHNCTHSS